MRRFIVCLLCLSLAACSRQKRVLPVPADQYCVAGMYMTTEEGRFFVAQDTLVITQRKRFPNLYQVIRLSGFQRSLEDQCFPVEHVRSQWFATYDAVSHTLHGVNKDNLLQILPALQGVTFCSATYTRIE
jgi:hypothetical protein